MVPPRPLTYSRSLTFTLTHDCPWHCAYCGFRTEEEGWLPWVEVDRLCALIPHHAIHEALIISGEQPGRLPHLKRELQRQGFHDFIDLANAIALRALSAGALPHGNYGALREDQLARLRPLHVSLGLMLENIRDYPWAPEKRAAGRMATIEAAGRLRIPFTSGLLLGLGETPASRLESLDALAASHHRHGHLQEILLQPFQPNARSPLRFAPDPLGPEDFLHLMAEWRQRCPDVPIQVPPNLVPFWPELASDLDDLGGISPARDEVNPDHPWAQENLYRAEAARLGRRLTPRLAVYDRYLDPAWIDAKLLNQARTLRAQLDAELLATTP
ncbi:MAG: 7,8-didemethyl-8-hydroxy-5-deazariboflavin synthase subunit CofG [Candidatus Methylacidiphilales bacterium]